MLNADPEIVTSLRYLSQDKKNPFTKAVTRACKRVGLLGPDEPLDPSRPLTKGVFVSVQVLLGMSNNSKLVHSGWSLISVCCCCDTLAVK